MPTNITLSTHEIINPLRKLLVLDGTSAMSEIWNQQEGQTELTERNISQAKQESKKIREHNKCECVGCLAANYSVKKNPTVRH